MNKSKVVITRLAYRLKEITIDFNTNKVIDTLKILITVNKNKVLSLS
jgi:hypothetical protein